MRQVLITLVIGLVLGAVGGAIFGWLVPIQDSTATLDKLHPDYQADFTVMVGKAYVADGDFDKAQSRLGHLALPDPARYVVVLAEQYIAEGRNPQDIRALVRLAAGFGFTTPPMTPYLAPEGDA